jgi:putative 4-mercaptohistidine N1-methyltranferase
LNIYESDKILSEYLLFHYGTEEEVLAYPFGPREALNFPVRCADWVLRNKPSSALRALDLGCAVGRSSFELSRGFQEVVGIDFSASFIRAAQSLQHTGKLAYQRVDEGILTTKLQAEIPKESNPERVRFQEGDACCLPLELGLFDAVLMANLLCRLPDPESCLERAKGLVSSRGILVLTTPCTWMEEFTPKAKWLGGYEVGVNTLDGVKRILSDSFSLETLGEEPFLIREHARKFQWSVAQVSVWRRV